MINSLLSRVVRKKRKFDSLLFPFTHFKTSEEKGLIKELRDDISKLARLRETDINKTEKNWQNNLTNLERDVLKKDPRDFLNWDVILYTMFHEAKEEEFAYLKNLPNWESWKESLMESPIGNPKPYPLYKKSSGNLIHHAYSLANMLGTFDIKLENLKNVFEFGGGYGSMARLAYKRKFTGTYTIFDLPEFIALQKYFLKSLHMPVTVHTEPTAQSSNTIVLLSDIQKLEKQLNGQDLDMVIATWSLSESPVKLRDEILRMTKKTRYYLIAYQNKFGDTDNIDFFKKMMDEHKEFEWKHYPIAHLPGSFYMFGKRKE